MKKRILLLLSISFLLFTSCFNVKSPELEGIKKFKITKITKSSIFIEIGVKIDNPNNIKFKIKDIDMDIFINDQFIGLAKLNDKVVIENNKSDIYNFKVEAKISKILGGSIAGVLGVFLNQNIKLKTKGRLTVTAFLIKKSYKIEHEQKFNIQDIPLFRN